MKLTKRVFLIILFFISLIIITASPKKKIWSKWNDHNPSSKVNIDHSIFGEFLSKYINTAHNSGVHLISYAKVSVTDKSKIKEYIEKLQNVMVTNLKKEEQKAYWINLYNAKTIDLILDNYPIKSISKINISPGLFSWGPWDAKILEIQNEELSLNDIEHRILRPIWEDNRIHYALNCASISCPNLSTIPFTSKNIEKMLDTLASAYVNHSRGVGFKNGKLILSSIYKWYEEDFGNSWFTLKNHLLIYASVELRKKIEFYNGSIYYDYDWNLNKE